MVKSAFLVIGVLVFCSSRYGEAGMQRMGGMRMGAMGVGGMGMGGMGVGGMGMGGMRTMGGMGAMGGFGGSETGGGSMESGDERFNDMMSRNRFGRRGMGFGLGANGFSKGEGSIRDVKGNSGFYNGMNGMKNVFEDGRVFKGGQFFGQDGHNQGQVDAINNQKKGHIVKGFKKSHQSDEASHSEDIYDEEHDQADKMAVKGEKGQFGETRKDSSIGRKADAAFAKGRKGEGGAFVAEAAADEGESQQGHFASDEFAAEGAAVDGRNGGGVASAAGHRRSDEVYEHAPAHY